MLIIQMQKYVELVHKRPDFNKKIGATLPVVSSLL
jgi:hypothetical protein